MVSMLRICPICDGALKVGDGNFICPTCDGKWEEFHFTSPPNPTGGPKKIVPIAWPSQLNPISATPRQRFPFRTDFNRIITSKFPSSEPLVFNDDDPLDTKSTFPLRTVAIVRAIDINTHTELPAVQRSISQQKFHILINIKAHVTDPNQVHHDIHTSQTCRAPIDLVTLLKRAMEFVIDNLGPSDRLSVISFSSRAHRLFPLLLMTGSGKQHALQAVNSLVAGGETNIVEGLEKGAKVIEDRKHKNPVCSIMLLSDGQDSFSKRINLKEISRLQIPVHTFGFGADHDPVMLHSIAEGSKGNFSFIEAEGLIQDAFAQCIGGLLSVIVQDLQVHVHSLDPYLYLTQVKAGSYSTYFTGDYQTGSVDIGDMYADEERDFLVLVNIPVVTDGNSNDLMKLVSVWCDYKDPFTKASITTEAIEVKLQRPEMVDEDMVVSIEVDRQKNRFRVAEAMSNSRAAAERGDLLTACSIIDDCRMQISETASMHAGDKFSVDLELELQELRSRMGSRQTYESTGRGYLLSGLSSHSSQKATTRGDSTVSSSYQTPSMTHMVKRSRASL
ncbi:hypothetical protein MKW92_000435 [Papaver armeniacum]|nr:hypothetical protein MKW92_000435 [Papaver armeniacum]